MYLSDTRDMKIAEGAPGAQPNGAELAHSPARLDLTRILDVLISLSALIFCLPLMIAVATAIKLQDGGPVLFGQMRLGAGGRAFRCWKFRSMVVDAEQRLAALLARDAGARAEWEADQKLRKDPRVTWLGRLIRITSIDELPQLINVLKGEMSLVGPRPIVTDEVRRYGRWFRHYCAVKPGITGLWQVSGRNDLDYRRRVAMDVLFARSRSVRRYLWVLAATVPAVARRTGVY